MQSKRIEQLKYICSIFLITLLHFAQYLMEIAVKSARKNRKSRQKCNIKFLETAQNIELHILYFEYLGSCWKP